MGERVIVNGRELNFNDLPPEPPEYAVWVDGLGEVHVRKGEPKPMRDMPELMRAKLEGGE